MKRIAIIASSLNSKVNSVEQEYICSIVEQNEEKPKFLIDLYITENILSRNYLYTNIIDLKTNGSNASEVNNLLIETFKKCESSLEEEYYSVWIEQSSEVAARVVETRAQIFDYPIILHTTDIGGTKSKDSLNKLIKAGVQFVTNTDSNAQIISGIGKCVVAVLSNEDISLDAMSRIIKVEIPDDLISVIVPVYNVQDYLKRCVETIINQTYKNLEIILVDDGSKDNGGAICDELAEEDSRIQVIHQKNAGLSAARNSGLDVFKGKYVFFVDSDDAIDVHTIEKLHYQLIRYNADIVACGYGFVDDDYFFGKTRQESITKNKYGCWNGYEAVYELIKGKTIGPVAWNKLYKAELWNDLRYPVGKIHEDEATTYKAIYNSKIVVFYPENYYKYYRRAGSIMSTGLGSRKQDYLDAIKGRLIYFKDAGEEYLTAVSEVAYLDYLRYLYRNIDDKSEKKVFAKEFDSIIDTYSVPKMFGIKKTIGLILWKFLRY